jgi:hypothetical protein
MRGIGMQRITPASLRKSLSDVRDAIQALDRTLSRLVRTNGTGPTKALPARGFRRLSGKARAALVLQGRYMGYMRQLKPREKKMVRQVKEAKGVRAAIAKARQLAA